MRTTRLTVLLIMLLTITEGCRDKGNQITDRQPVDTIGFAQYKWQVDSVLARIERLQGDRLQEASGRLGKSRPAETATPERDSGSPGNVQVPQESGSPGNAQGPQESGPLRVAVSPHDDYSYVGYLYPALFQHVRSKVMILFGVGHKARLFGLEDRLIIGSYRRWKSPAGTVTIPDLQEKLLQKLPAETWIIHDSLQSAEQSIEAMIPFIEYYNPGVEIIPIIVPAMSFERMEVIAPLLAEAIDQTMAKADLQWGEGWSMVITTDAVHYGNEDWGGSNYDRFGVDTAGYMKAVNYENEIMNGMLAGPLTAEKVRAFSSATVRDDDFREYKWTWCGRYSVPLGLLTAEQIAARQGAPLTGIAVGYSTSIDGEPIPVSDLGMGITAPAKLTHWVGYAAVGYR